MPRKKKTDQSPARVPGRTPEVGNLDHNTGQRGTREFDSVMAENFPSITPLSGSVKERIIKSMKEMFSHLEPDVIYIVLSECDFKGSTEHRRPVFQPVLRVTRSILFIFSSFAC